MEQWERDYIETITEQKQLAYQHENKLKGNQKEYLEQFWDEKINPDGSKYYVPKLDALRSHTRKTKAHDVLCLGWHLFWKVIFVFALFIFLYFVFFSSRNIISKFQNSTPSIITDNFRVSVFPNTYVDGYGMHLMVHTLWDISGQQTERLNQYIKSGRNSSLEELCDWLKDIQNDLAIIQDLHHDPSYSKVLAGYTELLDTLQKYVMYAISDDNENITVAYNEYVSLLDGVWQLLADAFDENHVKYVLTNDHFTYYYRAK